jgi:hypothetical protein
MTSKSLGPYIDGARSGGDVGETSVRDPATGEENAGKPIAAARGRDRGRGGDVRLLRGGRRQVPRPDHPVYGLICTFRLFVDLSAAVAKAAAASARG